jgi:hypothetical protein
MPRCFLSGSGGMVSYCPDILLQTAHNTVVFTGSGRVGKIVAGAAAKTLTPTTLEVGTAGHTSRMWPGKRRR